MKFTIEFKQGTLEQIQFKEASVSLLKNKELLYVIIADKKDNKTLIDTKLKIIAKLFSKKYNEKIKQFSGEYTQFKDFKEKLIELGIYQYNFGENSECEQCTKKDNINIVLSEIVETNFS